jgi:hypothetical protein
MSIRNRRKPLNELQEGSLAGKAVRRMIDEPGDLGTRR